MANNEQINATSYYALPSGRQLEDFIFEWDLDFATGSALKYLWRAGRKDGESAACVEELYDAVAVLMRMIAVVEGKQRLGGEA